MLRARLPSTPSHALRRGKHDAAAGAGSPHAAHIAVLLLGCLLVPLRCQAVTIAYNKVPINSTYNTTYCGYYTVGYRTFCNGTANSWLALASVGAWAAAPSEGAPTEDVGDN